MTDVDDIANAIHASEEDPSLTTGKQVLKILGDILGFGGILA